MTRFSPLAPMAAFVLVWGCFGSERDVPPLEPCRQADCAIGRFEVTTRLQPSVGVAHRLEATLCSDQCISAELAESTAGVYGATQQWLSLRVAPSGGSDDTLESTAFGTWPFGELRESTRMHVKIVDHGDGRVLVDETFPTLERELSTLGGCDNPSALQCTTWKASSVTVLQRPCVVSDCEDVPTAHLVADLTRASLVGAAPYRDAPPTGAFWSPLEVTVCRNAGCETFGILSTGPNQDEFICSRFDKTRQGPFECWFPLWEGDVARLVVDARGNREWIGDGGGDAYTLTVRNSATAEVLLDRRERAVYAPSSPDPARCVAGEPLCTTAQLDFTDAVTPSK